jgi:hypothetical protein
MHGLFRKRLSGSGITAVFGVSVKKMVEGGSYVRDYKGLLLYGHVSCNSLHTIYVRHNCNSLTVFGIGLGTAQCCPLYIISSRCEVKSAKDTTERGELQHS